MTEEQSFARMLDRANIPYEKAVKEDACVSYTLLTPPLKPIGYSGFYGEFQFDKDGNLITFGAWE